MEAEESDQLLDPPAALEEAPALDDEAPEALTARALSALERTRHSLGRDQEARGRDLSALARDQIAQARDRAAEEREMSLPDGLREAASLDRAAAAADRAAAASDRARAAADRRQARVDLARAHLDELTGAYTRGLGQETLRHEIERAHRLGEPFTLVFLDVDGLKALNDRDGHAAGDTFLRGVADAMRLKLRSYDPVVRVGGDEFVCGFAGTDAAAATERVVEIQAALADSDPQATISAGVAELKDGDTLEALMARGDADLYDAKRKAQG
jgi:diguanylate cyclase (GGDEF)-like protein